MNRPRSTPLAPGRHGSPTAPVPLEVWLGPDPELALVNADMHAWTLAHPCDCEALCECETNSLAASGGSPIGPAGAAAGSDGALPPEDGGRE